MNNKETMLGKLVGTLVGVCLVSMYLWIGVWSDYTWGDTTTQQKTKQGWQSVGIENDIASIYKPWTFFRPPVSTVTFINPTQTKKYEDGLFGVEGLIVSYQNDFSRTEETMIYYLVDCTSSSEAILKEGALPLSVRAQDFEWHKIIPNSPGEQIYKAACQAPAKWFTFNSVEDGFQVDFPNQPTVNISAPNATPIGNEKTTSYLSQNQGTTYALIVYSYDGKPDFGANGGLDGVVNNIANAATSTKLISNQKALINGLEARHYVVFIQEDEQLDGFVVYNGNKIYNMMVDFSIKNGEPSDSKKYFDSFGLSK